MRKAGSPFDLSFFQTVNYITDSPLAPTKYRFLLRLFSQVSLGILSQRATGCLSRQGQTTCTLLSNTRSQSCEPSPCACGCGPLRGASVRLCPTLLPSSPTSWCCCKACTPPSSCSSTTRCCISLVSRDQHILYIRPDNRFFLPTWDSYRAHISNYLWFKCLKCIICAQPFQAQVLQDFILNSSRK